MATLVISNYLLYLLLLSAICASFKQPLLVIRLGHLASSKTFLAALRLGLSASYRNSADLQFSLC